MKKTKAHLTITVQLEGPGYHDLGEVFAALERHIQTGPILVGSHCASFEAVVCDAPYQHIVREP